MWNGHPVIVYCFFRRRTIELAAKIRKLSLKWQVFWLLCNTCTLLRWQISRLNHRSVAILCHDVRVSWWSAPVWISNVGTLSPEKLDHTNIVQDIVSGDVNDTQPLFSSKYIQVLFVQLVTKWSAPQCLFSFNGNLVEEKSQSEYEYMLYYNMENFFLRGPLNGQICKW